MRFITVSYFADPASSHYYRDAAARLSVQLECFGMEQAIQEIAHRGSYRENCVFKPEFILRELLSLRIPVLWLDADSRLMAWPRELIESSDAVDIAVATPDGNLARAKASPLLMSDRPGVHEFLCAWIDRIAWHQRRGIVSFDHEPLLEVLREFSDTLHIHDLGPRYCVREEQPGRAAVIAMGISTGESKAQALREMQRKGRDTRRRGRTA